EQVANPGALEFSATNIAQMGYFILALSIVVFFANNRSQNLHFLSIGFITGSVLNLWAFLGNRAGLYFPAWIFDTSTESGYYKNVVAGFERFRGIFAEPSYLATFSIAALVFNVFLAAQLRGWKRLGALAVAGLNMLFLYSSYSGTAVVGFAATWAIIGAFYAALFLLGRARINMAAAV
ncbi:hypothetical protein, partial [Escherichia coli]|uniref:hypothetical protein n=1 Tax=Escherichia coli TaxID=562 RepID=UPI0032E440D0